MKFKIKIARSIPNKIEKGVKIVSSTEYIRLIGEYGFITLLEKIEENEGDSYGAKVEVDGKVLVYNETQKQWENEKGNAVGEKKAKKADEILAESTKANEGDPEE